MRKIYNSAYSVKANRKEYSAWVAMIRRCTNPKDKYYYNYGGRGIRVCQSWVNSFSNFLNDIGKAPSKLHSLDRKENNGNYEPGNCRWATKPEQQNNTRANVFINYLGQTKTLKQWCIFLNLRYGLIYLRMQKLKWPFELAISLPPDPFYNPLKRKRLKKGRRTSSPG